jgi:hypothetical protein
MKDKNSIIRPPIGPNENLGFPKKVFKPEKIIL